MFVHLHPRALSIDHIHHQTSLHVHLKVSFFVIADRVIFKAKRRIEKQERKWKTLDELKKFLVELSEIKNIKITVSKTWKRVFWIFSIRSDWTQPGARFILSHVLEIAFVYSSSAHELSARDAVVVALAVTLNLLFQLSWKGQIVQNTLSSLSSQSFRNVTRERTFLLARLVGCFK